jgi:hypothetical protein
MRVTTLSIGIASTAVLLALVPVTQAAPSWLKPRKDSNYAPAAYGVYESNPGYGGYSYGGYGPSPTIKNTPSSSSSAARSGTSGEATSTSLPSHTCK